MLQLLRQIRQIDEILPSRYARAEMTFSSSRTFPGPCVPQQNGLRPPRQPEMFFP